MTDRPLDAELDMAMQERPAFISTALGGEHMVVNHPRNTRGRDFVVGDIHGMFHRLDAMLSQLDFDDTRDRLFAIGDLIDRGPHSELAVEWLRKPWFSSIRGNHDQFLLDAQQYGGGETHLWHMNGGDWYQRLADGDQVIAELQEQFAKLPLLAEIETSHGIVGLVHADVPEDRTWEELKVALVDGNRVDAAITIWNRGRVALATRALDTDSDSLPTVAGHVYRVICGHARMPDPLPMGNMLMIDTGAAYERMVHPRFTVVQIEPGDWRLFEFPTWVDGAEVTELPIPGTLQP